jgi:NAD(P)H-nitrite reductase large subunit
LEALVEESKINLHWNVKVQGVAIERQEIIRRQEKRMSYGKLLLADGTSNRPPALAGADSEKMNSIRNLEDVQING